MRIPLLCLALLALAAPPAHADSTYAGGCSFSARKDVPPPVTLGGQGLYTGEMDFEIVLLADPPEADVSCEVRVNGVVQDSFGPVHVTVAGAGADTLTYRAGPTDGVDLCTLVRYADGTTDHDCGSTTSICDTECVIREHSEPYVRAVETELCASGDVYVAGVWVLDCPPYGP